MRFNCYICGIKLENQVENYSVQLCLKHTKKSIKECIKEVLNGRAGYTSPNDTICQFCYDLLNTRDRYSKLILNHFNNIENSNSVHNIGQNEIWESYIEDGFGFKCHECGYKCSSINKLSAHKERTHLNKQSNIQNVQLLRNNGRQMHGVKRLCKSMPNKKYVEDKDIIESDSDISTRDQKALTFSSTPKVFMHKSLATPRHFVKSERIRQSDTPKSNGCNGKHNQSCVVPVKHKPFLWTNVSVSLDKKFVQRPKFRLDKVKNTISFSKVHKLNYKIGTLMNTEIVQQPAETDSNSELDTPQSNEQSHVSFVSKSNRNMDVICSEELPQTRLITPVPSRKCIVPYQNNLKFESNPYKEHKNNMHTVFKIEKQISVKPSKMALTSSVSSKQKSYKLRNDNDMNIAGDSDGRIEEINNDISSSSMDEADETSDDQHIQQKLSSTNKSITGESKSDSNISFDINKSEQQNNILKNLEENSCDKVTGKTQCKECLKLFENENDLNYHFWPKLIFSDYYCKLCERDIINMQLFKSHNITYHQNHENQSVTFTFFTCNCCLKEFPNRHLYEEHRVHHLQKRPAEIIKDNLNATPGQKRKLGSSYQNTISSEASLDSSSLRFQVSDISNAGREGSVLETESATKRAKLHLESIAAPVSNNSALSDDNASKSTKLNENEVTSTATTTPTNRERCNECEIYLENFSNEKLLHKVVHWKYGQVWSCFLCVNNDTLFFNKKEIETHLYGEHGYVHICNFCNQLFLSKKKLQCHMYQHQEYCKYICDYCGENFNRISNKNLHVNSGKCRVCNKCNLIFACHDAVRHHDCLKSVICKFCNTKCKDENELTQHENSHLNISDHKYCKYCKKYIDGNECIGNIHEIIFKCSVCDREINSRSGWHTHRKQHIIKGNYKCFLCDFTNVDISIIISHIKKVHGENVCKCNTCKKMFLDGKLLYNHQIESGLPFQGTTEIENKNTDHSFIQTPLNLDIHTEDGQIDCQICHKMFSVTNLRHHIHNVHNL